MIVGLTGGIASGKSTVTGMLRDLGVHVVDADVWARKVVEPGSPALDEIRAAFGPGVLLPDGTLNRKALGDVVFGDESARLKLNAIIHPRVREGMKAETEEFFAQHVDEPIVWDVPLLFEGPTRDLVDTTVLVYVDEATQLQRLIERDGITRDQAVARMAAQMPMATKRGLADYIIDNTGSLDGTKEQVIDIWQQLRQEAQRG